MTEEQKYRKELIERDLEYINKMYDLSNRYSKLLAASHLYLVVKTVIILKADLEGLRLTEKDIDQLIKICDGHKIDIEIPPLIREKATVLNEWRWGRYNTNIRARKDSILKMYNTVKDWFNTINN